MLSWTRASDTSAAAGVAGTSFLDLSLRRLGRMPAAWIGGVIVLVLLAVALAGKAVAPFDPLRIVPADKLLSASPAHLFGTDDLGRDLLSRGIAGARISLLVGALVLAIARSVGVALGLVAGHRAGWMDAALTRTGDGRLAVP